ncbi:MAG TPA: DinB family protein [Pyrinomonadaceae bacterium]|nr:DinB family protein [Pyrinomonadaceae bacterium]
MSDRQVGAEVPAAFLSHAREFLSGEYLPKIEQCLAALTDEHVWWRGNEESNSIGNLLLHLCGNARQWIVSGLGGEADHRVRQTEFDERSLISKSELVGRLQETLSDVDRVLAEFDSSKLLQPYRIQNNDVTALEAIFHVVEHFSMHTGQIIMIAKLLAGKDMKFYDFPDGVPVHTWKELE